MWVVYKHACNIFRLMVMWPVCLAGLVVLMMIAFRMPVQPERVLRGARLQLGGQLYDNSTSLICVQLKVLVRWGMYIGACKCHCRMRHLQGRRPIKISSDAWKAVPLPAWHVVASSLVSQVQQIHTWCGAHACAARLPCCSCCKLSVYIRAVLSTAWVCIVLCCCTHAFGQPRRGYWAAPWLLTLTWQQLYGPGAGLDPRLQWSKAKLLRRAAVRCSTLQCLLQGEGA